MSAKAKQLRGWLEDAKADIAMIEQNLAAAVKRGMDDAEGGPSGALGERVGGTKDYTAMMLREAKKRQNEANRRLLQSLCESGKQVRLAAHSMRVDTLALLPLDEQASDFLLKASERRCKNPYHLEPFVGPPRHGRCNTCDQYLRRHGEERPYEMCHPGRKKPKEIKLMEEDAVAAVALRQESATS